MHPPMSWSNRSFVPPPAGLLGSLAAAAARSASLSTCLAHRAPYTCPAGRRAGTVLLSPLHRASRLPVPVRGSPLCPVAGWQAGTVPLTAPSSAARQVVEPVHGPPAPLSLSRLASRSSACMCGERRIFICKKNVSRLACHMLSFLYLIALSMSPYLSWYSQLLCSGLS